MAVYRDCKYCGKPISIRQMPAEQWVAFDFGTDEVHHCGSSPTTIIVKSKIKKITANPMVATNSEQILSLLKKALHGHRCVHLIYYTASRKALTDRIVEPMSFEEGYWGGTILRAYCRWRQDIRCFALSNIRQAELLEESFLPRSVPPGPPTANHPGHVSTLPSSDTTSKPSDSKTSGCLWWLILVGIVFLWWFLSSR
ncbi:MAG: WYL domain-containing protein [Bacillota bacterium]|nr:WYL domain-containing protein [Bacillota bacterium]